jgi:hypothetical protein
MQNRKKVSIIHSEAICDAIFTKFSTHANHKTTL